MPDVIARFKGDTSDLDTKIKKASQTLMQMESDCRKVGGAFINLEKNEVDFIKSLGQMETGAKSAKGTIGDLTKAFTDMSAVYNRLSEEEKRDEGGRALRASLDQLRERIKDGSKELNEISGKISNNGNLLDQLSSKFGINIKQLGGWGAALGAGKIALDVMKDAIFTSEENVDEWGRTIEASKGLYDAFVSSLNNGNLNSFFQNIQNVIDKAREAYDALDNLATKGGVISNKEAKLNYQKQQQMAIINDKSKSEAERKAAQQRLAALNAESKAAKKATADLNNEVVRSKISQLLTGKGFKEGTKAYTEAYSKVVRSLYDENYKMGRVNTGFKSGMKINNGKTTRYTDNGDRILDYIVTDEWRKEVNPYIQAVWNNLSQGESDSRMTNRFAQKAITSAGGNGGATTTNKPLTLEFKTKFMTEDEESKMLLDLLKRNDVGTGISVELGLAGKNVNLADVQKQFGFGDMNDGQKTFTKFDFEREAWEKEQNRKENKRKPSATDTARQSLSGLADIGNGLKGLGVDLGEGFDNMINTLNSIMVIIQGVQTIMSIIQMLTSTRDSVYQGAVVAELGTIAAATTATAVASSIPFFHTGGVIHAAHGYRVPGSPNGGIDTVPAMLSPGEVVFNAAQSEVLARELQESGVRNMTLSATLKGEDLRLSINNNSRRRQRGEYLTTR